MAAMTQIARFMGPTWGPPGSCRPQMGPMLAPWTLLSGELTFLHMPFSHCTEECRYTLPWLLIMPWYVARSRFPPWIMSFNTRIRNHNRHTTMIVACLTMLSALCMLLAKLTKPEPLINSSPAIDGITLLVLKQQYSRGNRSVYWLIMP